MRVIGDCEIMEEFLEEDKTEVRTYFSLKTHKNHKEWDFVVQLLGAGSPFSKN